MRSRSASLDRVGRRQCTGDQGSCRAERPTVPAPARAVARPRERPGYRRWNALRSGAARSAPRRPARRVTPWPARRPPGSPPRQHSFPRPRPAVSGPRLGPAVESLTPHGARHQVRCARSPRRPGRRPGKTARIRSCPSCDEIRARHRDDGRKALAERAIVGASRTNDFELAGKARRLWRTKAYGTSSCCQRCSVTRSCIDSRSGPCVTSWSRCRWSSLRRAWPRLPLQSCGAPQRDFCLRELRTAAISPLRSPRQLRHAWPGCG